MDFTAVGLGNHPPHRPAHTKDANNTSSALPPLLPVSNEFPAPPRRDVDHLASPSPRSPRSVSWLHLDKTQQQPTQVASWPLTFAPGSPKRGQTETTLEIDMFSPISPKVRKVHTRTRLVDDSRTRPALLQELQNFLHAELDGGGKETKSTPSLRRLQVVREVLGRLITGFSVYAPVLMRIRDEYEHAVESLHAKSLMVPGLQSRLQSVETHCLRQLSTANVEAKARSLTLKRRLADTQALLAASAAENARLTTVLSTEKENVAQIESKLAEFQRSTLALANSVRRHDESLRVGHERSLEDARALQRVTARYYHACDELAELKQTVAALEEQGNGEHVAADKNTIVLLTREIQELSTALTASGSSGQLKSALSKQDENESKHVALNHAFIRALDTFGVRLELPELLNNITNAVTIPEGIDVTAEVIVKKLRQVQQQQFALLAPKSEIRGQQSPLIFLTEPAELVEFNTSVAERFVTSAIPSTPLIGDFLPGRGLSADVPQYLQHDGIVRNLFLPRVKVEQLVSQVWDQLDEQVRAAHNRGTSGRATASSNNESTIAALGSSSGGSGLDMALERYLQRTRDKRADRIELVYNFLAGLERFNMQSSACRLFHLVLSQELPIEARGDHSRELTRLYDALVIVNRDRHFADSSSSGEEANPSTIPLPPGRVSLADVVRTLRLIFPWKSDAALSQLHRALLADLRGQPQVDYAVLLTSTPHANATNGSKPTGVRANQAHPKWQFSECLKMQRLDDLLAFRRHLQHQIRQHLQADEVKTKEPSEDNAEAQMISLHDVRGCLQTADSAMTEQDLTRILGRVSGLSARELLTHDDMVLDARQVLRRLSTMLLRPAGRFNAG